jgi:hypothetical protein
VSVDKLLRRSVGVVGLAFEVGDPNGSASASVLEAFMAAERHGDRTNAPEALHAGDRGESAPHRVL